MSNIVRRFFIILVAVFILTTTAFAQEKQITVREVFVPNSEMAKFLENCKDRVLLTRGEYESLLKTSLQQQTKMPGTAPPVETVFLTSTADIKIENEQAVIKAVLQWESYTDQLFALPLELESVAIHSATLDGEPALLGSVSEGETGKYHLFLKGKGTHQLELNLTSALLVDSVRQELRFRIPRAPKSKETLIVSGDVELKSGARVIERKIETDDEKKSSTTRFELLPDSEMQHLVLTLNSHQTRMLQSVLAKSVQLAEVTDNYEKLHVTFLLDVLHQAVDQAEFVVPKHFEVTDVQSPLLARWDVDQQENQAVLNVKFREPVTGIVSLNIAAVHFFGESDNKKETLAQWSFPSFVPQKVNGHTSIPGLLLDTQWDVQSLDASRLIPIGTQTLADVIPESVFAAGINAPAVRPVAAWYAPQGDHWQVTCSFFKPKPAFDVASHLVLKLNNTEQKLRGLFQVVPRHEKLFSIQISVPQGWKMTNMTDENEKKLPFSQQKNIVQVRFINGVSPGTVFPVFFEGRLEASTGETLTDDALANGVHANGARANSTLDGNALANNTHANDALSDNAPVNDAPANGAQSDEAIDASNDVLIDASKKTSQNNSQGSTKSNGATLLLLADIVSENRTDAATKVETATHADAATREKNTGWYSDWNEQKLAFPNFFVLGAVNDTGTIAVDVDEDMLVTTENALRLIPLDNKERTEFLAGVPTDQAFRYLSQPYSADLTITRSAPRLTARTFSLFRFSPSLMVAHGEVHYDVQHAKTKSLSFLLPEKTPGNISITGINGLAIKEYAGTLVTRDDQSLRRWDVTLAEPQSGNLSLAIDFEQTIDEETKLEIPRVIADHVAWQTGLISLEGHEELSVSLLPDQVLRSVDVGELAATQYTPGRCLLGVYNGLTDQKTLAVEIKRNPAYVLPSSLVQIARGETEIAADGKLVTKATYDLKTRSTFLMIDLRENEKLWSVSLDKKTIKPQKSGSGIMIDVPAKNDREIRELEVIWATEKNSESSIGLRNVGIRLPDLLIPVKEKNSENQTTNNETVNEKTIDAETVDDKTADNKAVDDKTIDDQSNVGGQTVGNNVDQVHKINWGVIPVTRTAWNVTAPAGYEVIRVGDHLLESETPRPLIVRWLHGFLGSAREEWRAAQEEWDRPRQRLGFGCGAPVYKSSVSAVPAKKTDGQPVSGSAQPQQSGQAFLGDAEKKETSHLTPDRLTAPVYESRVRPYSDSRRSRGDNQSDSSFGGYEPSATPYQKRTLKSVQPVQVNYQQNLSGELQRHLQFQMIGSQHVSQLPVKMLNARVITLGIVFVWGMVFAVGLYLLNATPSLKTLFLIAAIVLGTLFVLVPGLEVFARVFDHAVRAAFCVLIFYLFVGGVRMCTRKMIKNAVAAMILLVVVAAFSTAYADDTSEKPINIPNDTVVAFYDAEALLTDTLLKDGFPDPKVLTHSNQKLLVPYAKYVELWNLVHPDKKLDNSQTLPAEYAFSNGTYHASLSAEKELSVTGQAKIEIFSDKPVLCPLPIVAGVLTKLSVDDQDAKIAFTPDNKGVFLLQMQGKGTHTIAFDTTFEIERQGGRRAVSGSLPAFPACKMTLEVPEKETEFRCRNIDGQQKWLTQSENEKIETTLAKNGQFDWSWRSKVTEAEIDQSLTADSELRFSIREDSLTLLWDLSLAFSHGKHESFRLKIPNDYLVVSVEGENVRAWDNVIANADNHADDHGQAPVKDTTDTANTTLISVELLHQAETRENIRILLTKNSPEYSQEKQETVLTPTVGVSDAVMHHGRFFILRSPLLEVKPSELSGVSLTDMPSVNVPRIETHKAVVPESPIEVQPFQAYRFTSEKYGLSFQVSKKNEQPVCRMQNIIKLTPYEMKIDAQLEFSALPKNSVTMGEFLLPAGMRLDSVQSESPLEWSAKPTENGETKLVLLWPNSTSDPYRRVALQGTVSRSGATQLPVIVSLRKPFESGEFVIQTDPAFDVAVSDLVSCEIIPDFIPNWVVSKQRPLCRRALHFQNAGDQQKITARLELVPRTPVVTCSSISNVRLNSRSIEEVVLLNYNIVNAGVRTLQIELPKNMVDARIDAPLLQRKEIKEQENSLQVTLELQDDVMGEFRVLIKNDRQLVADQKYSVTIPKMLTGTTLQQYVVLENFGGADEMLVDATQLVGVRKISRQQKEWRYLESIFGSGAAEAYLVTNATPELSLATIRRETIKVSGAKIGLAETRFVFGENGNYRAEQIYRIDNKTEQFLDLTFPQRVQIWSIRILTSQEWNARESGIAGDFGQPVKPTPLTSEMESDQQAIRIPIVKTEVGDLDYVIRVVYAGDSKKLRTLKKFDLPFLEVLNAPVSESFVKLYLPEDYHYYFDGTMSEVDQAAFVQTVSAYEKQVRSKLEQTLQIGNPYEKARAINSLNLQNMAQQSSLGERGRPGYEMQLNTPVASPPLMPTKNLQTSNDRKMEVMFDNQSFNRGLNIVVQSESNWTPSHSSASEEKDGKMPGKSLASNSEISGKLIMPQQQKGKGMPQADLAKMNSSELTSRLSGQQTSNQMAPSSQTGSSQLSANQMASTPRRQGRKSDVDELQLYKEKHMNQNAMIVPQQQSATYNASTSFMSGPTGRGGEMGMAGPIAGSMSGGMGGMGGGAVGMAQAPASAVPKESDPFSGATPPHFAYDIAELAATPSLAVPMTTRHASLDIELPQTGTLYLFSAPQSDNHITVKPVSVAAMRRLKDFAAVAGCLVVVFLAWWLIRKRKFSRRPL